MMLQDVDSGITWDQELPDELAKLALVWFEGLPELSKIKV